MKEFTTSGFFVLRTPLFPFQEFLNFSHGLKLAEALSQSSGDIPPAEAMDADLQTLRARLREFARRPEVGEALLVASPEFSASVLGWLSNAEGPQRENSGGESSGRDKSARIEHTFYRYLARMTSRPTPFGLFAGCSVGSIGAETRLEVGSRDQYTRRSRLDMEYLYNLADKVAGDPALRAHLKFKPNTSLYMAAGRYHHAQGYQFEKMRLYRLVATEPTPYLDVTLQRASEGATPACLAAALVADDPEISPEEADAYVGQLIESQLLTAELVPPITGPEPIDDMIAQLGRVETMPVSFALAVVRDQLQKLDSGGLNNAPGEYRAIVETVSGLPAEFQAEHLVQVDMMKPAVNASLDRRVTSEILRGVELLHSIAAREHDSFRQFKNDFQERYQDQEIPLALALDEEVGIGFESKNSPGSVAEPLIDDLDLAPDRAEEEETRSGARDFALLRKVEDLARNGETVLELDEKLLKALRVTEPPPLPDAFAAMGVLGPPTRQGGKNSFHLMGVSGPSGAILLGRFCHADAALTAGVKSHMEAEEARRNGSQAVFAEIAHLPEGRIGNILFRPHLRKYEIPFLATSRVPAEDRIPVTDLMVSVRGGRVVLRSRRLNREVLPRLTSAHGYTHGRNLKMYKFLCLLQMQGVSGGLSWNWGALDQLAFLPRVTSGNIVFAPARWRVEKETLESLAKMQGLERVRAVDKLRRSRGMPRFVLLSEADNQLLIDFDNVLSIETLVEYVKKRPGIRLVEMFPDPDALPAQGPEGAFTHEIVVPFVREAQTEKTEASASPAIRSRGDSAIAPCARNFLPGSQWLFAKIHASPSHVDRLLLETIRPLVKTVLAENEAEGWFFIRYADPRWHLRLRFRGDPGKLTARVLPRLRECLEPHAADGRIQGMSLDTYEREIERYGGLGGMETAERFFQTDSDLALDLLASISDRPGTKVRWQMAFYGVNLLLAGLGLDVPARRQVLNTMGRFQEKKFDVSAQYRKQVSDHFRGERQTLEKLLDDPRAGGFPESAISALELYAERLKDIRQDLEQQQQAGSLTVPVAELAGSYVHMHLNRLFRSAANAQEMVLYDYLTRTYDSRMAREKRKVS